MIFATLLYFSLLPTYAQAESVESSQDDFVTMIIIVLVVFGVVFFVLSRALVQAWRPPCIISVSFGTATITGDDIGDDWVIRPTAVVQGNPKCGGWASVRISLTAIEKDIVFDDVGRSAKTIRFSNCGRGTVAINGTITANVSEIFFGTATVTVPYTISARCPQLS